MQTPTRMNIHNFSLVCTFQKTIKNFEVMVDVQKGPLDFKARNLQ